MDIELLGCRQSVTPEAARNLATTTKSQLMMRAITPRWLLQFMPWVPVTAGTFRVNRIKPRHKICVKAGHHGECPLPETFVDYAEEPREYPLSIVQAVIKVHTRVTDLFNDPINQMEEQVRLTVEAIKEKQEWELINNREFGLLHSVAPSMHLRPRYGPPLPDDLDELLTGVWKRPALFLAHPRAIAAFGRECTKRGVPPVTVNFMGSPFLTWRGVPLVPSNKLPVCGMPQSNGYSGTTSILLMRLGETEQGVIGLHQPGIPDEIAPSLSMRRMAIDANALASYLLTLYFSAAVLTADALACLDNVHLDFYHNYPEHKY